MLGKGIFIVKFLIKGYNFFKFGYVVKLEKYFSEDGVCYFRGKILLFMKKLILYIVFIILRDGKIFCVKCGCFVGIEGYCNYVFFMLFFVEEFCEYNVKNVVCIF